jgi:hypothetical protein
MPALVHDLERWTALVGVGLVWFRLTEADADVRAAAFGTIRDRAVASGGMATVIRGAIANSGPAAPLPAPEVQRRLKDSFDPAGILAPVPGG